MNDFEKRQLRIESAKLAVQLVVGVKCDGVVTIADDIYRFIAEGDYKPRRPEPKE